ncbi:DddA-like double-stranded DNA deaminase toxin [Lentzea sp. NPDC102401]|uniref:DddA-like double-stranded DNA deaminase toxin n=1 Tax=Lentzea sp. NPDC102401 TaxID=3364128 RepID=UPI00382B1A6A
MSAQLDQVTAKAEQAISALVQASELAEGAGELIESAIAGTTEETEAARVLAIFGNLQQEATALINALREALDRVARIRGTFDVKPAAAPSGSGRASYSGRPLYESWAQQTRNQLPMHKTSGIWRDADGNSDLVQSGREEDGEHEKINENLIEQGLVKPNRHVEVSKHVETKVAWRMRQSGVDRVELVVNMEVCDGSMSCRKFLPFLLGPGQTLVVHDPVSSHTFRGRDAV